MGLGIDDRLGQQGQIRRQRDRGERLVAGLIIAARVHVDPANRELRPGQDA